jgi:hypothetical protein
VVTVDGQFAGSIASFLMEGDTEITYWIDRAWWSRGVAGRALTRFLAEVTVKRPLFARAASDNAGSLAVLRKAGFREVGRETGFANGRQAEIEETVLTLELKNGPGVISGAVLVLPVAGEGFEPSKLSRRIYSPLPLAARATRLAMAPRSPAARTTE